MSFFIKFADNVYEMKRMRYSADMYIILGFAVLHALVCLGCRLAGLPDEVMLTLLTMLMVVVIFLRRQVSVLFMAGAIAAVNIVGYFLGMASAFLFGKAFSSPLVIYPASTFFSTLVIGASMLWAETAFPNRKTRNLSASRQLLWLLAAFAVIIAVRLAIMLGTGEGFADRKDTLTVVLNYFFTLAVVVIVTVSAIGYQERAREASRDAEQARWRYRRLMQQVDPHFLFNSLNVLDCLISEQSRQAASSYTHRLAAIYRYMLDIEDAETVNLRAEMDFVEKYVDLLRVRFPKGLEVEVDIPEEDMGLRVVPCCIQLLIENATKHNAVRPADPLHISISSDGRTITVRNDIHPRMTSSSVEGTGLGLKYIRQQYMDIASRDIDICEQETVFSVTLPLLGGRYPNAS